MQVNWELRYQNITLYKLTTETDHFSSSRDTFGSKLTFSLQVEPNFGLDRRDLISIGGEIYWRTDNVNVPSSFVIPDQPIDSGHQLVIPMPTKAIRQIEEARNGDQVSFQIAFHGLCYVPPGHEPVTNSQVRGLVDPQFQWLQGRTTVLRSDRHTLVPIHREKWAALLKGMDHTSYRLVELPALGLRSRQEKRWESVLNRFDTVIQKQRIGNFEECIEECRKVVDELIPALSSHLKLDMNNQKTSGRSVEMFFEKALSKFPAETDHFESYRNLMFAITNFSSLYHHVGRRPAIFGNLREQSNLVVMLCSAAVTAAAKLLQWEPADDLPDSNNSQ